MRSPSANTPPFTIIERLGAGTLNLADAFANQLDFGQDQGQGQGQGHTRPPPATEDPYSTEDPYGTPVQQEREHGRGSGYSHEPAGAGYTDGSSFPRPGGRSGGGAALVPSPRSRAQPPASPAWPVRAPPRQTPHPPTRQPGGGRGGGRSIDVQAAQRFLAHELPQLRGAADGAGR